MAVNPVVGVAQFRIEPCSIERNLAYVKDLVKKASELGVKLLVLPELWSTGYCYERFASLAVKRNSWFTDALKKLAQDYKIFITGSFLEVDKGHFYNTGHIIGPGEVWFYRKTHLIKLLGEDKYFTPGGKRLVVETSLGKIGLAICYDLRFPEFIRLYALDGVQVMIIPAEWPSARIEHWRILLRARSIENQFYLLAANTIGEQGEVLYGGYSAIISPWGETLAEAGPDNEVLLTTRISLEKVYEIRGKLPLLNDRRIDLYRILDIQRNKAY